MLVFEGGKNILTQPKKKHEIEVDPLDHYFLLKMKVISKSLKVVLLGGVFISHMLHGTGIFTYIWLIFYGKFR